MGAAAWNWCACDSNSRAGAILQLGEARTNMQRDLASLRIVTAKVNRIRTLTPSVSFIDGPTWMMEVWQLLLSLAEMPPRSY